MKKLFIFLFVISILITTSGLTYSTSFSRNESTRVLLVHLKQNSNIQNKLNAIDALANKKNDKAFKYFVNTLCFIPNSLKTHNNASGVHDLVRTRMAKALKKYKSYQTDKLKDSFNALRKVVEKDPVDYISSETALTLSVWSKKWDILYKRLLTRSILKRIKKVSKFKIVVVSKFINALQTSECKYAYVILNKMLAMGYNNRINLKIKKILDSRSY